MILPKLTIYTRSWCPYCDVAMSILKQAGIDDFEEISIDGRETELRTELMKRTGRYDVPQVFIGDRHLGDDDDLRRLHTSCDLQKMLLGPDA